MVFCTLFDSYYLDKGLVMYRSLEKVAKDFKLYIYAFDEKAYDVLTDMGLEKAVILQSTDLESAYPVLGKLKAERSKAEYSWTCTPVSIHYILNHFEEEDCTYIDADLCFFKDPETLFNEIKDNNANIGLIPHRFSDSFKDRRLLNRSGKYCVQFNYFDNSENSMKALEWWMGKCFEWCYHIYEKDRMGDQKYLVRFPELFDGVYDLQNLGGGTAPWNLAQYVFTGKYDENESLKSPILKVKKTGEEFPIVFFHYQSMRYISEDYIIIRSETHSKKTKDVIYRPYLVEIEKTRKELKDKYGILFPVAQSYASNPVIRFLQKYVLRFKMKSLTDLYNLRKLRK